MSLNLVYVTTPDRDSALALARTLVAEKRIACGNLIENLTSVYEWDGQVQTATECLLLMKTVSNSQQMDVLIQRIRELHPYETPCILVYPASGGLSEYLNWAADQCTPVSSVN